METDVKYSQGAFNKAFEKGIAALGTGLQNLYDILVYAKSEAKAKPAEAGTSGNAVKTSYQTMYNAFRLEVLRAKELQKMLGDHEALDSIVQQADENLATLR